MTPDRYVIVYTESYCRRAARFFRKHPELLSSYDKTLCLLEGNPFHPSLRLHKLKGRLSGLHSVSITIHHRLVVTFLVDGKSIVPVDIGSHADAYRPS